MNTYTKLAASAALVLGTTLGAAGCGDFLTGGELSTDPNRPLAASTAQYFVGVQSNVFYTYSGDLTRIAGLFAQQIQGVGQQYLAYYQYSVDENTSNGALRQLYGPGGLADVRREEASALSTGDTLFLGIAQVQEAMLMGFAADVYGDIVYTHALTNETNPPLDKQLAVYDSLQLLLSRAIGNMGHEGGSNVGPGGNDMTYGGDPMKWIELAHTLKARFYMHTAEVRGTAAYDSALVEAQQGISTPANDYKAIFTGAQEGESNPWYQFTVGGAARSGYYAADPFLDQLLLSRNDPRRTEYFTIDPETNAATDLSDDRLSPTFAQPIATYVETQLIIAEAAYRLGQTGVAQSALVAARVAAGFSGSVAGYSGSPPTGTALLREILTEEYINDFQLGVEAWKLYRRTCFPNLPNQSPTGTQMPGRIYYDTEERLTNTNIPEPGTDPNGKRSQVDPPNATSDVGGACLAGA